MAASSGTYMDQRGGLGTVLLHLSRRRTWPILNSRCSSIDLALHRPPRGLPWRVGYWVALGSERKQGRRRLLGAPTGGGRYEAAPCADGIAQRPTRRHRLWRAVDRHAGAIGLAGASQQAVASARSMKEAALARRHDGQSSAPGCRRRTNPLSCPRRTLAPTHQDTDYGLRNG